MKSFNSAPAELLLRSSLHYVQFFIQCNSLWNKLLLFFELAICLIFPFFFSSIYLSLSLSLLYLLCTANKSLAVSIKQRLKRSKTSMNSGKQEKIRPRNNTIKTHLSYLLRINGINNDLSVKMAPDCHSTGDCTELNSFIPYYSFGEEC